MRALRSCSALTIAVLSACAQQHEGRTMQDDPAQASAVSESGEDTDSDVATNASSANATPPEESPPTPPAGGSGPTPPAPNPPAPPATPRVPGVFPGTGQVCARQVFDSLMPAAPAQLLRPCSYWVTGWPRLADPKFMRVTIDGKTIPLGEAESGWTPVDDGRGITLLGSACEAAQAGASITITAECQHPILI